MIKRLFLLISVFVIVLSFPLMAYSYNVRVGLKTRVSSVDFGSQFESVLIQVNTNKPLVKLKPKVKYTAFARSGKIYINKNLSNDAFDTCSDAVYLIPINGNSFVYCKQRWYRGVIKLIAKGNCVTAVNVVDMEDYLKGVVPSEMPAIWNIEALKAQTIAARSYAIANIKKRSSEGYDLNDTTQDQVYKGVSVENYRSNRAVIDTKDMVLVHNNKIIPAYYHSSSGGFTDNDVWSSKISFVKPVKDFDQQSPNYFWRKEFLLNNISSELIARGVDVGVIAYIMPFATSQYGRIKSIKLVGTTATKIMDGEQFRKTFNLPSNLFHFYKGNEKLIIEGRGSGHGIGLSQWGAKALADKGYTYYQILGYYFNNIQIKKIQEKVS